MAVDDNIIIDMLREQNRAGETRSAERHTEVMNAVRDLKSTLSAHEVEDDKRFEEINKWRYKAIGGGVVLVTALSFAAPVAAHMLGVSG